MLWSISTYISSNISSVVLFLLFVRYLVSLNKSKRLPKGPSGLPLIGYLPFLGKSPYYTLWKLGEKYGSIYTLPLGEQNIVILNDWESIRDALRKDAFLGRPHHSSFSLVTGFKSLIDDNNASWRENRRVFEGLFRTCFDSPTIHKNLLNELKTLLIYLKKSNGNQIEFREKLSKFIGNFFYSFIFGKHFISPKALFDSSHFIKIAILSLYPSWMAKIYYKSLDIFNRCHFALFAKFFRNATRNHYKTINNETSVRDLIDGYILEMQAKKTSQTSTTMSIDKLRANCQIFLCFGSEAFLSCIEWSLISVAYFPQYQKIISDEILAVIGAQRIPELKDEPRIPFTLAFLNEVLRWKTVFPFNFMRRSTEDATILGHFIPKDTLVLANIWAVHHDPHIWENPSQFNPHRFLSDNGKILIDHEGFMPFSLGKRSCVAEPFVRKLLLIYFVAIVQKFSIALFNEEEAFEEEFHITLRPKGSVKLVFRLRSKENDDVNI